jgi:hypothetical protein
MNTTHKTYSRFIFFATFEWTKQASVLVIGKPLPASCHVKFQHIWPIHKIQRK